MKSQANNLKNQLARALADYENLKKRTDQERLEFIKFSSSKIIAKLLPILDMLNEAQKHLGDSGLAITIGEFEKLLTDEGVTKISVAKGDVFDENIHEAVEVLTGKMQSDNGKIAEVILPGWQCDDGQVVRHAKVKVYKL
jgi:molecular chaperone GrpE